MMSLESLQHSRFALWWSWWTWRTMLTICCVSPGMTNRFLKLLFYVPSGADLMTSLVHYLSRHYDICSLQVILCFSSLTFIITLNWIRSHVKYFVLEKVCSLPIQISFGPRAVASLSLPGGQDKNVSSIFLIFLYFPSFFLIFSSFSSSFWTSGGRLAHPGRPWLRHCSDRLEIGKLFILM